MENIMNHPCLGPSIAGRGDEGGGDGGVSQEVRRGGGYSGVSED